MRVHGLVHQQRLAQVPPALHRDPLMQTLDGAPALLLGGVREHVADLLVRGGGHAHEQRPRADRGDYVGRRVGEQDEAQVGRVLFHGPAQGRLGVAAQVVRLIDDHDLEALLGRLVDLLRLRHLLEEVLDDDAVVVAHVGGRDLLVVHRGDNVELELAVAARLEDARVNLDLLHAGPVELLQGGHDSRLFSGARGSVYEEMGKVAALCLLRG